MRPPLALAVAILLSASAARADRLAWHDGWDRFRAEEAAALAFAGLAGLTVHLGVPSPEMRFDQGFALDLLVRDALVLRTRAARGDAARASDVFLATTVALPLTDAWIVAGAIDQNGETTAQMTLIAVESYVSTLAVVSITQALVGRQRPYFQMCVDDPLYDWGCDDADITRHRNRSFISGHAALSFTGAALACTHRAHLRIYDNDAADLATCVTGLAMAATTATLRVVADKHHFTDVLAGATIGIVSGYVLPSLLHYGFAIDRDDPPGVPSAPSPPPTLTWGGTF
jgi:membrane-associated phospholipid phosphatase